ncbi:MAG: FtsW/RodA/SpoVE family cell cycle protein, partial [Porticoccaceae bacterium]
MYTNDFVRRMQSPGGDRRRGRSMHIDIPLLLTLIALCLGGLIVLYSASGQSAFYVKRQGLFMLTGFVAMFFVAQLPVRFWERYAVLFYAVGLLSLI